LDRIHILRGLRPLPISAEIEAWPVRHRERHDAGNPLALGRAPMILAPGWFCVHQIRYAPTKWPPISARHMRENDDLARFVEAPAGKLEAP